MTTNRRPRKLFASVLAGIGITAGAAGIADAVTTPRSSPSTPPAGAPAIATTHHAGPIDVTGATATADSTETADTSGAAETTDAGPDATGAGDSTYTASVVAPLGTGSESSESAALAPLAKITAADATKVAVAAVPGTAGTAALENENGNLVYSVVITAANGTVDVKVDAGNGKILAQDSSTESGNDNG